MYVALTLVTSLSERTSNFTRVLTLKAGAVEILD